METIKKVISFLDKHPDYFEYHKDTLIADEIFFQSIVGHLFRDKPELIKTPITYVNWEREDVPLPVTFTEADFDELQPLGDEYLFARKFDEKVDKKIFDLIDAELINNGTL